MRRETALKLLANDVRAGRGALFLGAGISMAPPTCLPSGPALKDLAVRNLRPPAHLEQHLHALRRLGSYRMLLPEIAFQRLHDVLGTKLVPFFRVLSITHPNLTHRIVARLSTQFDVPIVTTNFDTLVDRLATRRTSQIVHLHGSVKRPDRLVVLINQVGRGLSSHLRTALSASVEGRTLYVLGYSGNDHDVLEALKLCNIKRVIWVARHDTRAVASRLRDLAAVHPLHLARFDIHSFFVSVAKQLRLLRSTGIGIRPPFCPRFTGSAWAQRWASNLSVADRVACLEALLFECNGYQRAISVSRAAVHHGYLNRRHDKGYFYNAAALAWRRVGDFRRAAHSVRHALAVSPTRRVTRAASYNIRGLVLLEQTRPRPRDALPHFVQARRLLRTARPPLALALLGRVANNEGLAHAECGNISAAIEAYSGSLRYKRRLGDLLGTAQTAANMALVHLENGMPRHDYWERLVLDLTERYGLHFQRAYFLREAGVFRARAGKRREGLHALEEALLLYKRVGSVFGERLTRKRISEVR